MTELDSKAVMVAEKVAVEAVVEMAVEVTVEAAMEVTVEGPGPDKVGEHASAARRKLIVFCRKGRKGNGKK